MFCFFYTCMYNTGTVISDGLSFSKQWQEAIDSDTDSLSITSEPSHDSSPAMSPQSNRYNLKHSSSNNDLSSCGKLI